MANINSLNSSSSVNSIYGNRNIFTGLASGMDTEGMIENAVSGIKTKIESLQKQSTTLTWKQDAYRSIIDKLANFSNKYTSYASDTNLSSQSFFNSAATMTPNGKYADKVSASGKTSSDIQILGIRQLATAATYRTKGLGGTATADGNPMISAGMVDLGVTQPLSKVSGSLTIKYGTRSFELNFDELDTYDNSQDFAEAIQKKLAGINLTNSSGETVTADTMVDVTLKSGNIVFSDKQAAGNSVYISSATGKIKDTLGIDASKKPDTLNVSGNTLVDKNATKGEYLSGKEMQVTLDGITKTINLPEYKEGESTAESFVNGIQEQLDKAFGKDRITVSDSNTTDGEAKMSLRFTTQQGSTMSISSEQGNALGLNGKNAYSYTDNNAKLGDILKNIDSYEKIKANGEGKLVKVNNEVYYADDSGNRVGKDKDGNWWRVDDDGAYLHEFKINGKSVGNFSRNTAMETVINSINNSEAGVSVSYSKTTNEYLFTAKESGSNGRINFDKGLEELFGKVEENSDNFQAGTDAIFSMTVNGRTYESVSRSSNSFEIDGMTLNLKGTFGEYDKDTGKVNQGAEGYEAISFTSGTDTDKIVDAVKSMVNDYNEMIKEVKNAYSTLPAYKDSKYTKYEPLTEEEAAGLTDTELKNYEEKAKQGILFGDSNLSALYNGLRNIMTSSTSDYNLNEIGLSTSYSNGLSTISLDESKLRAAIDSNPDKVKSLFTRSKENGSATDGIMANMKKTLDTYAKTTGDKGVLINLAGSVKAPASLNSNSLNTQINSIQKQIDKWTDKYTDRVDYYTRQFTKLEQLIAEMNSQSSALMGLMGGSAGY